MELIARTCVCCRELAKFLEQTRSPDWPEGEPVHAIYFVSGEMPSENIYAPMPEVGYKPPVVIRKVTHWRILLVPEEELEGQSDSELFRDKLGAAER